MFVRALEAEQEIHISNQPAEDAVATVHVSGRLNKKTGTYRPLVDASGMKFASIISIDDKVEITVFREGNRSNIVVRPLRFDIHAATTVSTQKDQRLSLLSLAAGGGLGTASFLDTEHFVSVQEIEFEDDSAEVLKHNYPNSYLFVGDLRDVQNVVKSDVSLVTLPCNDFSKIGDGGEGVFNNLVIGAARILRAADSRVCFFENVPGYYKSAAYKKLQIALRDVYPYWMNPIEIDSFDWGSIAHRPRAYSLAFKTEEDMFAFQVPKKPRFLRKKLREVLDHAASKDFEWKPVARWMESFRSKAEKGNSWADRSISKTFVTKDATELQTIPKRYRSQSCSNSYVLSDDGESFRFLTISELRKIFSVPEWFSFPDFTPLLRQYEMLGQAVDGRIFKVFANAIAELLLMRPRSAAAKPEVPLSLQEDGQLSLLIG
ncbi:DNA cytosine methyltransferase [Paenibacillus abyssi]|uniref:DNA (cytosine-5-)-methyltransferase n=1 Tax=Paenibacillus abyssi TaxID=1340531 RepID=A0A917LFP1_9BACL|nr:DNA cytosine methyltransferase [Paenibacillus abyssi]GGG18357.1 hypothetical protein GCM10010916_38990 [Paenibacillus abyssi]